MSADNGSNSTPKTMRAWTHSTAGIPSAVLTLAPAIPVPHLVSTTDVLVRITHASLSPGGSIMMQLCPSAVRAKPSIPELDFSGIIVGIGAAVPESRNLKVGLPVFGSLLVAPHIKTGAGSLAEYIVVQDTSVVEKPDNISFEKAAGIGVSGCTSMALIESAKLKAGDMVLVNGASGGIGSMVVQLAKEAVGEGGKVVAVCSGSNIEMVKKLGADEVIDYQANFPLSQYLTTQYSNGPFDVIIDAYGVQDLFTHCADYLKPGKSFVSVGIAHASYSVSSILYSTWLMMKNSFWPRMLGGIQRDFVCVQGFTSLPALERLGELAGEGILNIPLDSCWDMEDALKAYDKMLSRRAKGKIVVKVQDP